jgi:hypothetical protein
MHMKGLSVIITIALFLLAQGLAEFLKRTGARPADRVSPPAWNYTQHPSWPHPSPSSL